MNATATLRNSPRDPRIPGGWPPGIGPSEVAGVSMQRVREAAAVLNEEQHVYGAHFLDQFGRLLPIRPHRRRRRAVRKPKPKLETKEENQRRLSTLYGVDYDQLKGKGGAEGDGDSLASSGTGASAAEGEGEEEEEEAQPSPEQERGAVGEAAAEVVEEIVAAVMDARQQQADAEEEERQQKTQAVRGNVSILGALGNAMGKGFGALGDFRGGGGSMRSMK